MQEIWKDIEGYEGFYQVSNKGNVKRVATVVCRHQPNKRDAYQPIKEKILKHGKRKDGYLVVVLCKEGKCKSMLVHRLVATAFLPNTNNYPIINHKDENKQNNDFRNLEWCTHLYNNTYNDTAKRRQMNKKKHWKLINGKRVYYNNEGDLL